MANTKITELTAVTALAETDVFPVVDVSANTTNKVSVKDLLRNAPDGSASAPSIANAGDQDTGIFFPADNSVGVSTDGTQRLVIDSSGRVGIGVANPGCVTAGIHAVHDSTEGTPSFAGDEVGIFQRNFNSAQGSAIGIISGTAGTSSINFGDKDDADVGIIQYGHSDNSMRFFANAGERMQIDSSGRVYVGGTQSAFTAGPGNSLSKWVTLQSQDATTTQGFWLLNQDATFRRRGSFAIDPANNTVGIYTQCSSGDVPAITFTTATSERMRISSGGNVGIGTTSPADKLHVVGNGRFNDGTNGAIQLGSSSNNRIAGGSSYGGVRYYTNGSHAWYDSSSELMKIDSSGNVGIGISSPVGPLHLVGDTSADVAAEYSILNVSDTSDTTKALRLAYDDVNDCGVIVASDRGAGWKNVAILPNLGNVGIGTTSPATKLHVSSSGDTIARVTSADGNGAFLDLGDASDPDGGRIVYDSGSNLAFSTASSERVRIDSSGRVGIGTSGPTARLTIAGGTANDYTDGILLSKSGGNAYGIYPSTNNLEFRSVTGSNHIATFDYNGKIGIGNTAPSAPLAFGKTVYGDQTSEDFYRIKFKDFGGISNDVGIGQPDENSLAFNIQGGSTASYRWYAGTAGERMRLDGSGRVGIGTTSPSQALDVVTSTGNAYIRAARNSQSTGQVALALAGGTSGVDWILYQPASSNDFRIFGNSSDRLTVTSAGNVGIGTTSPGNTLHLKGAQGVGIRFENSTSTNSSYLTIESGDKYQFNVGGSGYYTWVTGGSEKVRLDSSGRLLVGHTSSVSTNKKLQVSATDTTAGMEVFRYSTTSTAAPSIILSRSKSDTLGTNTLVDDDNRLGNITFRGADGSNFRIAAQITGEVDGTPGTNDMPGKLIFSTTPDGAITATERMHIREGGGLRHFATSNPSAIFGTTRTGSSNRIFSGRSGGSSIDSLGTEVFIVRADGDVENTNNSYTAISDAKLKENIIDANSQWSDLKALRVRNYNFKEETNYSTHTQIGLVAQEVETVSPGLVSESPDTDDEGNDLGTTTKAVNYSVLYMKAVKALQEAMERIETLEAKVAALEAQ